jgi:hypothetical protein
MTRLRLWLALFVLSATLTQCKKESLPPESQTGAGVFACRINGAVWKYSDPKGALNLREVTNWTYSPNENQGKLRISGYNYGNQSSSIDHLGITADSLSINKIAIANVTSKRLSLAYDNNQAQVNQCANYYTQISLDTSKNFYRQGKLEVTKLDLQAKIISGRFECTIFQTGCDTLKITDGRFDLKF